MEEVGGQTGCVNEQVTTVGNWAHSPGDPRSLRRAPLKGAPGEGQRARCLSTDLPVIPADPGSARAVSEARARAAVGSLWLLQEGERQWAWGQPTAPLPGHPTCRSSCYLIAHHLLSHTSPGRGDSGDPVYRRKRRLGDVNGLA